MFLKQVFKCFMMTTCFLPGAIFAQTAEKPNFVVYSDVDGVIAKRDTTALVRGVCVEVFKHWRLFSPKKIFFVLRDLKKAYNDRGLFYADGTQVHGSANYVRYFADKYEPRWHELAESMEAITGMAVKPIEPVLHAYAKYNLPVMLATNNDHATTRIKLATINSKTKYPLQPFAQFCAGEHGNDVPVGSYHVPGKSDPAYFKHAYEHALAQGCDKDATIVFVEDTQEFVDSAHIAAKRYGINIKPILFDPKKPESFDAKLAAIIANS